MVNLRAQAAERLRHIRIQKDCRPPRAGSAGIPLIRRSSRSCSSRISRGPELPESSAARLLQSAPPGNSEQSGIDSQCARAGEARRCRKMISIPRRSARKPSAGGSIAPAPAACAPLRTCKIRVAAIRNARAIIRSVAYLGAEPRRAQERFRGNAAGVQADAAKKIPLHQSCLCAGSRRFQSGNHAAVPAAQNHQIRARTRILPALRDASLSSSTPRCLRRPAECRVAASQRAWRCLPSHPPANPARRRPVPAIPASAHQVPQPLRAIVFNRQHDESLIEPRGVAVRYPPEFLFGLHRRIHGIRNFVLLGPSADRSRTNAGLRKAQSPAQREEIRRLPPEKSFRRREP